jgi:hypothetical protein
MSFVHPMAGNPQRRSEVILKILSDADPEGIGKDELRDLAAENGIDAIDLHQVLGPLMANANIYYNASTAKYHFIWSSPLQWE